MEEKVKTKKHILRKVLLILLILFIIFLILTLRRFIIFNKIGNLAKDKVNSTNYYAEKVSIQGNTAEITKSYNKDSKYLTEHEFFGTNIKEKRKITVYQDEKDQIGIIQSGETKIAIVNGTVLGGIVRVNTLDVEQMTLWQKLLLSAVTRVTTENCKNKECYLVEYGKDYKAWVDKETGLIIREITSYTVMDSYYEFNIVKDEKIIKPDISDCKIQENT